MAIRTADDEQHGPAAVRVAGPLSTAQRSFVVLRDGSPVDDPRDLLAAVGVDGPTGLAVAESEDAEMIERAVTVVSGVGVTAGLTTQLLGLGLLVSAIYLPDGATQR